MFKFLKNDRIVDFYKYHIKNGSTNFWLFVLLATIIGIFKYGHPSNLHSPKLKKLGELDDGLCKNYINISVKPPCEEVCDISLSHYPVIKSNFDDHIGRISELIVKKSFDCFNIINRMRFKGSDELLDQDPPRYPPLELIPNFTMNQRMPIRKIKYFQLNKYDTSKTSKIISESMIKKMESKFLEEKLIGTYGPKIVNKLYRKLKKYMRNYLPLTAGAKSVGLVIGSQAFWIEMLLLKLGIDSVITWEYANIQSTHPKLRVVFPYEFAEDIIFSSFNDSTSFCKESPNIVPIFDVAVAYSSLEHSGLGRYGDELNPYGDLEAMAQTWCLTKPGGLFFLNVPYTNAENGYIEWNAHRIYSLERILHMASNWIIMEPIKGHETKVNMVEKIFVFSKPYDDEK